MRLQQSFDARSHVSIGTTAPVQVALKLGRRILLQGIQKNLLGIECHVAHWRSPLLLSAPSRFRLHREISRRAKKKALKPVTEREAVRKARRARMPNADRRRAV